MKSNIWRLYLCALTIGSLSHSFAGETIWQETFENRSSLENFSIGEVYNTPAHWDIIDGALRGKSHREDKHPAILYRKINAQDVEISARIKLQKGSGFSLILMGKNPHYPWGVLVRAYVSDRFIHLREDHYANADGKELPVGAKPPQDAVRKKTFLIKKDLQLATDKWHQVTFRTRGKEAVLTVNDEHTVKAPTTAGHILKSRVQVGVGMNNPTLIDDLRAIDITGAKPSRPAGSPD